MSKRLIVTLVLFALVAITIGGQTVRFALPQVAGDPGTLANGDLWYNTSTNAIRGRANGATVSIGFSTPISVANGGTNLSAASDDNTMVGNGTTWQSKAIPDCDSSNSALEYDTTNNAFACVTITGGGGGGVGDVTHTGSLNAALALGDNTADITAYAGSSCSAGSVVTAISANGTATCSTTWTFVTKAVTESVSSNTTPQADDELFFTMVAAAYYEFELYIEYDSPVGGGTPDFKYQLDCPATCNISFTAFNFITTSETQTNISAVTNGATAATAGTSTTARIYAIRGWATSSAGGSGASGFLLSWSQNTSGANATRVLAGSFLQYRRLS